MMPFATIAAAVGMITVASAEIDGLEADALTSTVPAPIKTQTQVTAIIEANPTIVDLVITPSAKPDASKAVAKVDAELPPTVDVAAKEGVPVHPDLHAQIGMKYGMDDENSIDWMDPDPTARYGMKYGTDDENSTDWMK